MNRASSPSRRRWTRQLLAASAAAALVGCDDVGERQVLDVQAQTTAARTYGGGTSDETIKALQGVASAAGSSPAVIQSLQSLGQLQLAKGRAMAVELSRMEAEAGQTIFRIGQLARQARTTAALAANARLLDPTKAVAQIADVTAKARGDGNATVFPSTPAESTVPTLAVAQQEKSRLDGEVAKGQAAIDAATPERDALLAQAGSAGATLESQTGDARAATVKQIADLRGNAAAKSRQISDLTSKLERNRADQSQHAALAEQLQAAVDSFTGQGSALTQGWQEVKSRSDEQSAFAKGLLQGDADSVRALAATLNEQLKAIDAKRGDVEAVYKEAIGHLETAAGRAATLATSLGTARGAADGRSYESPAWESQAKLLAVDRMNLDKAQAEKALADLRAGQARWLGRLLAVSTDVAQVSEALNVAAPEPFNGDKLKADLTTVVGAANGDYDTVIATLLGVSLSGEDLAALRPIQAMTRIVTLNDHAALADLASATGVAPELAAKAKPLRDDAKAAAAEARDANVPLPAIPVSLGGSLPTTAPAADAAAPAVDASETPSAPAADDPAAAELRTVMLNFMKAAEAGNADEVKQQVVVADGADAEVQVSIDQVAKLVRFRNALASKFADNPLVKPLSDQMTPDGIANAEKFRVEGDLAYSSQHVEGEPEEFRKVDGVWKGVISLPVTEAGKAKREQAIAMTDALGTMADEIEAGTLTDPAEIVRRVVAAMAAPSGQAPAGEGDTPPAEGATPPTEPTPAEPPAQ